jgi:hypothetical protein
MNQRGGAIWASPHEVAYEKLLSHGFPLELLWVAPYNRKPNFLFDATRPSNPKD